ncbi:DUF6531 domain-containing protein [Fibrella aquatilis]|uniref:DUF4280 domain-containing protein n=1 Tax=Fibrella aquatilis TaxID=2817059 RepID=A0A939K1A4_9BACT|nr:DUF6531 domain-containing protein [Fibrella aquatilis]MBO0933308.1 DUF4280 domain-containing protein [Fibrella aquatilis]
MSEQKYIPAFSLLTCNKGTMMAPLLVTFHKNTTLYGPNLATDLDKMPVVNIPPLGVCTITKLPCVLIPVRWSPVKDDTQIGSAHLLLDNSKLECGVGGKISIHFTRADAMAALPAAPAPDESLADKADNFFKGIGGPLGTYGRFQVGVAEGLYEGGKGLVGGLWGLAKGGWNAVTHPRETAAAIGRAAEWTTHGENWVNAATSAKNTISSAASAATNPDNWAKAAEWARTRSPRDWGNITGQVAFEVGLTAATAGAGTALNAAAKTSRVARAALAVGEALNVEAKVARAITAAGKPLMLGLAKTGARLVPAALKEGKAARALQAVAKVAKPVKCFLFGDPVDAASGSVLMQATDFTIDGPIPLVWERTWYSRSIHQGALGHGWHHSYDLALVVEEDGQVAIRTAEGQLALFEAPVRGGEGVLNRTHRLEIFLTQAGEYQAWHLDERRWYHFLSERESHLVQPLMAISDQNGFAVQFDYNSANHLRRITDSAGRVLQVDTDDRGQVRAIFSPPVGGASFPLVRYGYDASGNLTQIVDAEDNINSLQYHGHLLVQRTNPRGVNFFFRYDGQHHKARCVQTWGDGGVLNYKFRYDSDEQTTIWNSYDQMEVVRHEDGLVYHHVNALGASYNWSYNNYQELLTEVDPLGNASSYSYDSRGHQTTQTTAGGGSQKTSYDKRDLPVSGSDAQGGSWQWTYDERGNLTERVDPLGAATTYSYDAQGHLLTITDATGQATQLRYDREHNLSHIASPGGAIRSRSYDELGRLISLTDPSGAVQRRRYDRLGQLIEVLEDDGTRRAMQYDGSGNVVMAQEGQQQVSFSYTALNQMAQRQQAGQRIQFGYDLEGRLTGLLNEAGLAYQFELDAAGQVIAEQGFDGLLRRYERDSAGRVVRAIRPAGRVTDYTYTAGGQVSEVRYSDGTAERYQYDGAGSITEASNDHTTVRLQRNGLGLLTAETQGEHTVSYEYDQFGQRTHIRSSLGADVQLGYDRLGNIERMSTGGWQATFGYDQRGLEIQRQLSGGISVGWQYDSAGRPVQQRISGAAGRGRQRTYQWRGGDQLAAIGDSQRGTSRYAYDPVGNLVGATYADGTTEVRVADPVGNLFESQAGQDRRYGPGGQLLNSKQAQYTYDAEGNLTRKDTADGPWHYRWNGAGMLTEVTRPDGQTVQFGYDALGRRVSKTFRGKTTRWVWDGDKPLHEWTELSLSDKPGSVEDVITWLFEEDSFVPLAKLQGSSRQSILTDHLGTPLEMVDRAGQRTWEAQTTSYGRIRLGQGTRAECPFRFQGQYEDVETGLYYNRFRYYAPQEGIYISQDPIKLAGGISLYSYVHDPLSWIDQYGLAKKGGSYSSVRKDNKGGEVHHTPAHNSYDGLNTGATHSTGPAFHMDRADHLGTGSHGHQGLDGKAYRAKQRKHIQAGRWDKAVLMDIKDIQGNHGKKYNSHISEMLDYTHQKGLISDAQHKRLKARLNCK